MYIKTQKVGERTMVHERSHYELTLATSDEDGAYLIALVQIDDNLTPLAPGILCAKLDPGVDRELAGQLIDHLNAATGVLAVGHQQARATAMTRSSCSPTPSKVLFPRSVIRRWKARNSR